MKKLMLSLLIAMIMVFSAIAGGSGESAGGAGPYKVMFSTENGSEDIESKALYEIRDILNESGLFDCEVFIGGALGSNDDTLEQAINGAPIVTISDPGRLMNYVYDFGIIQMPYIFDDISVINKLMDTDIYKEWDKGFLENGVKLITCNWFSGPRNFVLNKQVNQPSDLKGQKIRTIGSPIFIESVNAMGAVATPMSWSEVYSGIEQLAIDGCEAQTPTVYASHIYEVCDYLNKTEHFLLIGCPVIGTITFDSWSPEAQELFVNTFKEIGIKYQGLVDQMIADEEAEMAAAGMIINEVDKDIFKEAVQPVYEKLGYTELREQIYEILGVN